MYSFNAHQISKHASSVLQFNIATTARIANISSTPMPTRHFVEIRADHKSCREVTSPSLNFHTSLHASHPRPVDISKPTQSSASVALNVIAETAAEMARWAYVMHLLLPAATDKLPTRLSDPESTTFTSGYRRPIFSCTGAIGEAVIA